MSPLHGETQFQDQVRACVEHQWWRFEYYKHLCLQQNLALADLTAIIADGAYHRLPSVASPAFKLSKGLVEDLNDLSRSGVFQVSSSTSGDPSYVYTSFEELARVTTRYGETFSFPDVTVGVAFAPALRILNALSRKAALNGKRAVLRMSLGFEGSLSHYSRTCVTVDVNVLRTLVNRAVGQPAAVKNMPALEVASFIHDAELRGESISLGGLCLLLRPYLDEFHTGEFNLHGKGHVAFSGGG